MQQLKQHIEKRFGDGIEYKGKIYNMQCILDNNFCMAIDTNDTIELFINDLCSVECTFIASLDWNTITNYKTEIDNVIKNYGTIPYHRMQLSLLSDEKKIIYLLENTK